MTKELMQATQPFRFYTRLNISELTGLKAATLGELYELLKNVPGSCIYHHTHRFLQQHEYLSPEPPNDFAYWVSESLNEGELGEELSSIDTIQFSTIRSLREKIIETIQSFIEKNPESKLKFSRKGEEFHFIKSLSFIVPTDYIVTTLGEFAEILEKITIDSIYFHIFEARLRLEKGDNDFSHWIMAEFGNRKLADTIARLDPYTYTLDQLRATLIRTVRKYL